MANVCSYTAGVPRRSQPSESNRRDGALRWQLSDDEERSALFADESAGERHLGRGRYEGLELLEVNARTIINRVPPTSRMPFRYTINAYRGCSHACVYCFARPTHEYLGMGTGEDFERRIVVKINAAERLRAELRSPTWRGEHIAMGTNTDPYQAAEGRYHLTRRIVEVLAEVGNPFSILTKSTLVLRDLSLLQEAASRAPVRLDLSIGTLDPEVWRLTEPGTPPPAQRLQALRKLTGAGITCGVLVAPVIPGLSDDERSVKEVVEACREAGAASVGVVPLHLRPGVKEHYLRWLSQARPDLVPLHQDRFGRGAYQPPHVHQRLGAIPVTVLGRRRSGGWRGAERAEPQHPTVPAPHQQPDAPGEQLSLL